MGGRRFAPSEAITIISLDGSAGPFGMWAGRGSDLDD